MLIRTDTLQPWNGEPLADGVKYGANLEQLWEPNELLKIGLIAAIPFVVPDGSRTVGGPRYELADGTVREIFDTEAIPARPPPAPALHERVDALGALLVAKGVVSQDELTKAGF